MSDRVVPRLAKWPFVLGDLLLLAAAAWIAYSSGAAPGWKPMILCLAAVALGAWLCAIPFLREYAAALKIAEADALATTVAQIQNLEQVKSAITQATSQWQVIQDQAGKTALSAKEITERMSGQVQEFQTLFQQAHEQEKNTLRLEVEKLRRSEGESVQTLARILDFVYSLHNAGLRSGQSELIRDLTQFQNACRDAARRVGLTPFTPAPGDPFDPQAHQTPDDAPLPPAPCIAQVIATGFTYQAQLVRRALVRVQAGETTQPAPMPDDAPKPVPSNTAEASGPTDATESPSPAPGPAAQADLL